MNKYKYLIVGGGITAASAIAGVREKDKTGTIGVVSAEQHKPYDRPPLSKGLWKDQEKASIWRKLEQSDATFHLGRSVESLALDKKQAVDSQGGVYQYDKLLLATGCSPRRLPFCQEGIVYFRTVEDYDRLRSLTEKGNHFAVIGGGFIGSEIAAALTMNKKKVSLIFPSETIGSRIYPAEFARHITNYFREKGVEVLAGTKVVGCEGRADHSVLKVVDAKTGKERQLSVDGVIAGLGVLPNTKLAEAAGLKVDNGIVVDTALQTSQAGVYAAGDVASFYNASLKRWVRVEHEDNANTMGRMAGLSMAGDKVNYDYLPLFYTDLFELGYEAVGDTDSRHETFADWHDLKSRTGVIYYLNAGKVCGAILCNLFGKVDEARKLIQEGRSVTTADLRGTIH